MNGTGSECVYVTANARCCMHACGVQTCHDGRIYSLRIHCGDNYPNYPPEVAFTSRINMTCVDAQSGRVDPRRLAALASWNRSYGIENVLVAIRNEMASPTNRRLPQPPEGSNF